MFCSCKNDPDERHPNVNICPVCMGHPGDSAGYKRRGGKKSYKNWLGFKLSNSRTF